MARTARASAGNLCYDVLNRSNARQQVFFKDGDYAAFVKPSPAWPTEEGTGRG